MCGSGPWTCSGSTWQLQALPPPCPPPFSQGRGTGSWVALSCISFLFMVRIVPTSPNLGTAAVRSSLPVEVLSLWSPWAPLHLGAQDDRSPRCRLCWRHRTVARDPETKKDGEGVGGWGKDKERERWAECEGSGKRRGREKKTNRDREEERW